MKDGRFYAALVSGAGDTTTFHVDMQSAPDSRAYFAKHWSAVDQHVPPLYEDDRALCWELVEQNRNWLTHPTAQDRLQLGWFRVYRAAANVIVDLIAKLDEPELARFRQGTLDPAVRGWLDEVEASGFTGKVVLDAMGKALRDPDRLLAIFNTLIRGADSDPSKVAHWLLYCATKICFLSPQFTDCGLAVPWIDNLRGCIVEKLRLLPDDLVLCQS
ncbi:MAG: hypothetical protein FJ290_25420 [Planctomycetes bacterium]|nr:hypothetical protein [Planctomycetota bacterium]